MSLYWVYDLPAWLFAVLTITANVAGCCPIQHRRTKPRHEESQPQMNPDTQIKSEQTIRTSRGPPVGAATSGR